ncbi:response regulator [Butyrivibrio sp. CB08]|uniref:response regulator transcription factor n=1 Tax=Butyrivibrio sp. CB08 TaxID=2364879 RepID=UPI000EA98800|nr:response regulator [Butyrivibrio sp. CB08]RKM59766.1 response regulator [Butyrivibrio sp. CB08]
MYRILVADDEPIERQVINKKIMGFFPDQVTVFMAENGIEAVSVFEDNNCQIAILDIEMPGMNGLDAASEIRKAHPECSIIFLTAFDEFTYAKRAIEVRALDYLLKPGSDEDLINVIEEAMRLADRQEELEEGADPCEGLEGTDTDISFAQETRDGEEIASNIIVGEVTRYIENNYKEDIALQDVAGLFGYSDVYFCKLFKQNFGKNFITYLNEFRMDKAKELLADPQINIKDVSIESGYRDANYFTRVFKRMVGMTPSEYRNGVLG